MKLRTILLIVLASLCSLPALAVDLSAPYSPTRSEWLQVALHTRITQVTDLWQRRVGVVVVAFAQEQEVAVVVSSSNGQGEPTKQERQAYVQQIEGLVKGFLTNYEWAKDLKVSVRFQ